MFLDDAMAAAERDARERMAVTPPDRLESLIADSAALPSFKSAIARENGAARVIAEVKRSSPSAGVISREAKVADLAREYEAGGASAVSVLTSAYKFEGDLSDLAEAGASCGLPLLRKEFISQPYQVLEARAYGASAVLLISEALSVSAIRELTGYAGELGMDALVESHSLEGLEKALDAGADVIGINNRDLETLEVDTRTTERLMPFISEGRVVVSESGIRTDDCAKRVSALGVDAMLIGEELMRAARPAQRLAELLEALEEVDESCG